MHVGGGGGGCRAQCLPLGEEGGGMRVGSHSRGHQIGWGGGGGEEGVG